MKLLLQKYNVPGPRYTSYPTVPFWDNSTYSKEKWITSFKTSFRESNQIEGISLYIHLPFCESLCTFCACHKYITKRHEVEEIYIKTVLKEWQLYLDLFNETPIIKELHLGGGTPTFFSDENLEFLINGLFLNAKKHDKAEFSFEGHPNNTTKKHLQTLYNCGFRRVSFGVQDYNFKVQTAIHRIQSFENVKNVTNWAKEIGYKSVSHDLIFGLPHQTKENIIYTINKTKELKPDRISFYSYAHVPWVKGVGQRGFNEKDLPKSDEKRSLYETGKMLLSKNGYYEIGMDHFALKEDELYNASIKKSLHRNFMGYSSSKTQLMIGLGMSSISDSWYGFAQNTKNLKEYQETVNNGELPVFKGHILSHDDCVIRRHILNIMCNFYTSWKHPSLEIKSLNEHLKLLEELEKDRLIYLNNYSLSVLEKGKPFLRNICMAFDKKLIQKKVNEKLFSMTV